MINFGESICESLDMNESEDQYLRDDSSFESDMSEALEALNNEEMIQKLALSANITSSIMLRIPTHCLPLLRRAFDEQDGELNLIQYLQVFVRNMEFEDDEALLSIVPDLVDLFQQVDINGDGHMEWSEFVMFVIEQVTMDSSYGINEKIELVGNIGFPKVASSPVQCSKTIEDIKRCVVCVDDYIYIYRIDKSSPAYLSINGSMKLTQLAFGSTQHTLANLPSMDTLRLIGSENKKPMIKSKNMSLNTNKPEKKIGVLCDRNLQAVDVAFLPSKDYLFVLRNDFSLEMLKLSSRSKFTAETVIFMGIEKLGKSYTKIALRDVPIKGGYAVAKASYAGPYALFALGSSNSIEYWEMRFRKTGQVEYFNPKTLNDHKDYVRDMLVIQNETYKYFVTCSLDKTVILYDLESLEVKAIRSGHTMGVQCLAYDNKSVLLAGSYDYSILGWDLDCAINKPLFHLVGHESVITKIVALGDATKCFSLDQSGTIKYWDISRSCPYDREARHIYTVPTGTDDRIRQFDVIQNLSSDINVIHDCVMLSHGRKQHSYRVTDATILETPPLHVLYSHALYLIVSVHAKCIIFWNVISGSMVRRIDEIAPVNGELCCAILDDRERKLIVGDSSGQITVYNCLTGYVLKKMHTLPYAIRQMIYSPDKTIIVLAGQGDIFIFDELPNDPDEDANLRDVRGLEVDVISLAYYYELALIATSDVLGNVTVYNYLDLSVIAIIPNVAKHGTDICQISFLNPLPLLLVTDTMNNFIIIPVGPAMTHFGRRLWRLDTIVIYDEKGSRIESDSTYTTPRLGEYSGDILAIRKEIIKNQFNDEKNDDTATDDDKEKDGSQSSIFNTKKKHEYLLQKRDVKCMSINMRGPQHELHPQRKHGVWEDEPDERIFERINNMLEEVKALAEKRKARGVNNAIIPPDRKLSYSDPSYSDPSQIAQHYFMLKRKQSGASITSSIFSKKSYTSDSSSVTATSLPQFPSNISVQIVCGFDDGTISKTDLTAALRQINVGIVEERHQKVTQSRYNPRKVIQRQIKDSDIESALWTWEHLYVMKDPTRKPRHISTCDDYRGHLVEVWQSHNTNVNVVHIFGAKELILSAGDDKAMKLWNMDGELVATLTRGRELDKIFQPKWVSPINISASILHRIREAKILAEKLHLRRHEIPPATSIKMELTAESLADDISAALESVNEGKLSFTRERKAAPKVEFEEVQFDEEEPPNLLRRNSSNSIMSLSVASSSTVSETERSRIIGQLYGRVTYLQTKRERVLGELVQKYSKRFKELETWKKKLFSKSNWKSSRHRSKEDRYLDAVMADTASVTSENTLQSSATVNTSYALIKKKIKQHHYETRVEHVKMKTKFDIELERIDSMDPLNWDVNSVNRQRLLYQKYYREIEKYQLTRDPMIAMVSVLNELSPNGDFIEFSKQIKQKRQEARDVIRRRFKNLSSSDTNKESLGYTSMQPLGINISATAYVNVGDATNAVPTVRQVNDIEPHATTNITMNKSHTTKSYEKLVPLPVNRVQCVSDEMKEERQHRQELLIEFEQRIQQAEKFVRIARKNRRKEKIKYKILLKEQKQREARESIEPFFEHIKESTSPGSVVAPLPVIRHAAATIKLKKSMAKEITMDLQKNPRRKSSSLQEIHSQTLENIELTLNRKIQYTKAEIENVTHNKSVSQDSL